MNDDVEEMLKRVKGASVAGMRDGVMFEAGRALGVRDGARGLWGWRAGCAAMAVCLGVVAMRPAEVRTVVVERAVKEPAAREVVARIEVERERPVREGTDYVAMRQAVLSRGVDALEGPPTGGGGGVVRMKLEGSESLPAWQRKMLGS